MEFKIRNEHRNPEYRINPTCPPVKVKKAALPLLIGILAVLGTPSSATPSNVNPTMGEPVYEPIIYTIDNMIKRVDEAIQYNIDIYMKNHVPLKLKSPDGKQVIEFIADGYSADKNLAYEWITAPNYTKDKKDSDILSAKEISFISNSMFGETMILVINTNDAGIVWKYVSTRMVTLKKSFKK